MTGYFLTAYASLSSAMLNCVKKGFPTTKLFIHFTKGSCPCCVQRSHYKIYQAIMS